MLKMSSMCSNASSKTWTPLPDCFIDEHQVPKAQVGKKVSAPVKNAAAPSPASTFAKAPSRSSQVTDLPSC